VAVVAGAVAVVAVGRGVLMDMALPSEVIQRTERRKETAGNCRQ
jgi:hypothetical protein